ncbi:hypothetical protein [Stenotrophomonas maltophilia]|uniref:hypothetical protein n=1 Tax=Stenotrophomonas maltophilia TaxID=40324 RepID=UPI00289440DA|nr:hypothetical protein [Stenotrophomonas maltophilia]MDT3499705.1 hypothetical protein [Stenotrophomonas maltophilia]
MSTTFTYGEIKAGRFRIGRRALWIQSEVQCWVRRKSRMLDATKKPLFPGAFLSDWRREWDSNPRKV